MDPGEARRRAYIFGSYAEEYDRWRPTYPDSAVDWLVPAGAERVVDVGAGTGKLTGRLVGRVAELVAVEPDEDMLRVLRRNHPEVEAYRGAADALPLLDSSVDAVLVAAAWHWFPHDDAVREVRRVLRPGGWLGLAWNVATTPDGWRYEVALLDPDFGGGDTSVLPMEWFGEELPTASFHWDWDLTPAQVRSYLATHSGFAVMAPAERERRLSAAEGIVAEECRRLGSASVSWPYITYCYRWQPTA